MRKKEKKGFFAEFKAFISQGNILDMAIGVVVGTAFKSIVSSLVADIIMPIVGKLIGTTDFSSLKIVLTDAVAAPDGTVTTPEVAIRYGLFIQYILDFLIIALCMFVVVKAAMSVRARLNSRKAAEEEAAEEAAAAVPETPTVEEQMLQTLGEIKTLLEDHKNG